MKVLLIAVGLWLLAAAFTQPRLLLSPLFLSLLLAWLLALAAAARRRGLQWACGIGLAALLSLMTPAVANALLGLVEQPLSLPGCVSDADRIHVLLAGGNDREARDATDLGALGPKSLARAAYFARQFADRDQRPVVIAGGGPGAIPESRLMAVLLERLGVPAPRLRVETKSQNTWGSAVELRRQWPESTGRVVLSSSALHLPRASLAFSAQGFDVCLNPLYSEVVDSDALGRFVPQSSAALKTEAVLHELLGTVIYRSRL